MLWWQCSCMWRMPVQILMPLEEDIQQKEAPWWPGLEMLSGQDQQQSWERLYRWLVEVTVTPLSVEFEGKMLQVLLYQLCQGIALCCITQQLLVPWSLQWRILQSVHWPMGVGYFGAMQSLFVWWTRSGCSSCTGARDTVPNYRGIREDCGGTAELPTQNSKASTSDSSLCLILRLCNSSWLWAC